MSLLLHVKFGNSICHYLVGVPSVGVNIKMPMRNKMACESTFTVVFFMSN